MEENEEEIEENDKGITPQLKADILSDVKLFLNINDTSEDTVLTKYIDILCNKILIITNRRMFIPELKYVVIDLVQDAYIMYLNNLKGINDFANSSNSIQSMSETGRSVTFGATDTSKALASKLDLLAKKQIEENDLIINKYKLLYKT